MATITLEVPDDRAQTLQDLCDRAGTSVSKWFNGLFDNGFINKSFTEIDAGDDEDYEYEIAPGSKLWRALKEDEEMTRHPEKYKAYTDVGEMFKEILAEPDD